MHQATLANSASSPTLCGTGNEYRPKNCGNALRLGSKYSMAHSINGQTCGWQVKLCDPSSTRANLSALEMSIAHIIKRYTNVLFTYLLTHFQCIRGCVAVVVAASGSTQLRRWRKEYQRSRRDSLKPEGSIQVYTLNYTTWVGGAVV